MDRLVALPIPGESFLLQRNGLTVLVDGGNGSRKLVAALASPAIGVKSLDVVICTHGDKDHAGGLTDLLRKSEITIKEFWLPGEWADVVPELIKDPKRVAGMLVEELDSSGYVGTEQAEDPLEAFEVTAHAVLAEERNAAARESRREVRIKQGDRELLGADREGFSEWLGGLLLDAPQDGMATQRVFENSRRRVRYRMSKRHVSQNVGKLWLEAIDTGERIRQIAVQAIEHGVRVRWFSFQEFMKTGKASGGLSGQLEPLNAVELATPPDSPSVARFIARLTPVNEHSLVFASRAPGESWLDGMDVIFTGDSPLGHGARYEHSFLRSPRDRRCAIATAPHHGSEHNSMAYGHLEQATHVFLWVRAGGTSKHPGPTFRAITSWRRACTHCPMRGTPRQLTEVSLDPYDFPFLRLRTHGCDC